MYKMDVPWSVLLQRAEPGLMVDITHVKYRARVQSELLFMQKLGKENDSPQGWTGDFPTGRENCTKCL